MKLARVAGTVVSTINAPIFDDRTLLLCDLIDPRGKAAGGYMIAVDTVGAGLPRQPHRPDGDDERAGAHRDRP